MLLLQEHARKILIGYIDGIESFGLPEKEDFKENVAEDKVTNLYNLTFNISQHQSTAINIDVIFSTIKEELTGKQLKELQEVIDQNVSPKEKRNKIIEKLVSFGSDVASNIVATILTNPQIIGN